MKTYVKSCRIVLAGLKGNSTDCDCVSFQFSRVSTSLVDIWKLSQFRTADSSKTLTENGKASEKELDY